MTDNDELSPVTPEHALMFGFIINFYAKIELNMQVATAGILDTDLGTAVILLGDMNSRQKRQTLRHLNTTVGIDGAINAELMGLLDEVRKCSTLRNWIAHATWTTGRREGAIKPMQLYLKRDEPKELGHHHNEQDFTADDLKSEAAKLDDIDRRFRKLLEATGLQDRVQANIDATKPPTASSPG